MIGRLRGRDQAKPVLEKSSKAIVQGNRPEENRACAEHSNRARAQLLAGSSVSLRWLLPMSGHAAAQASGCEPGAVVRGLVVGRPCLVQAARAEAGTLTVYSSVNEQEALPFWKLFEDATGIKVEYVRASDVVLIGRIAIEQRARQRSWDLLLSPAVGRLPRDFMQPVDPVGGQESHPAGARPGPPLVRGLRQLRCSLLQQQARQSVRSAGELRGIPHSQGMGRPRSRSSRPTCSGSARCSPITARSAARKLVGDIVATLKPVLIDGHLALARAVAAGEYAVTLNNYLNLTVNMRLTGAPTDYWGLDPVAVFFGSVAVNPLAPHPKTAALAANFVLSKEAQHMLTTAGRLPVRPDVMPNPPDAITRLGQTEDHRGGFPRR